MTKPTTPSPPDATKTPLKILMLHGYTQSGELFRAKARALEKHLQKTLPAYTLSFVYPTAPIKLNPDDIPFKISPSETTTPTDSSTQTEISAYAWWRRSTTAEPPVYLGLDTGLEAIARVLTTEGPFDGIIGFSQGAACAALVASLLEPGRRSAFAHFSTPKHASTYRTTNCAATNIPSESAGATPIAGIPFPASFEDVVGKHAPVKFVVCYSGFRAPGPRYRAFYERPGIRTPVLHVLGSLDAVVEEARSKMLIAACEGDAEAEGRVLVHPGGHFLPSQRKYLDYVGGFIGEVMNGDGKVEEDGVQGKRKQSMGEVPVEDMDVPF